MSAGSPWKANYPYTNGQIILDPTGRVQEATGTYMGSSSGATIPAFNTVFTGTTADGTMSWFCHGFAGTWLPSHSYAQYTAVRDYNGNYQIAAAPAGRTTRARSSPRGTRCTSA